MRSWVLGLVFAFGTASAVFAQGTASITGVVGDDSGGVLPGVSVQVVNVDTGIERTVVTDSEGRYRVVNLPGGNYEVRGELPGFRTAVRRGISLHVDSAVTVDVTLQIGGLSDEIIVSGEAPLVETNRGVVSGLVDAAQIENLPLSGRSFTDLALLQPGVTVQATVSNDPARGTGVKISFGGARQHQISYTMDGADISDVTSSLGSVSGRALGVDGVQEFRVVTSAFSAEYAKASGGEVQIATRSGTNSFHGSVSEFFRNDALNARDFFDQGDRKPPFKMNQFGASLGGPIVTNRTFFFTNYEGVRENLTNTIFTRVPDANVHRGIAPNASGQPQFYGIDPRVQPYLDLYPLPNGTTFNDGTGEFVWEGQRDLSENYVMGRVDHQVSGANNLFGRYVFNDGRKIDPINMGMGEGLVKSRTQFFSLGLNSVATSRMVNALGFSFNRSFVSDVDYAVDEQLGSLLSFARDMQIPPNIANLAPGGGVASLGSTLTIPTIFDHYVFQVRNDLSWQKGAHGLKFGANVERVIDDYDGANTRQPGQYNFLELRDFLQAIPNQYGSTLPFSDTVRNLSKWDLGFYAQDDWKVKPNLTVNLGLRYEYQTTPVEKDGKTAQLRTFERTSSIATIVQGDPMYLQPKLNFSPRVGFAWDVTGSGKTAVRGGAGLYYDPIHWLAYRVTWNRVPPYYLRGFIQANRVAIDFPNAFVTQAHLLGEAFATEMIQFELDPSRVFRYGLEVQHQLTDGLAVGVQYSGTRGYNLMAVNDYNQRVPEVQADGRLFFGPNLAPLFNAGMERARIRETNSKGWYDGAILSVRQRLWEGAQFQIAYTFAKATDLGSNLAGSADFSNDIANPIRATPPGFLGRSDNKGLSAFDVRHNLVINGSYAPPSPGPGVAHVLLGGWVFNGIARFTDGNPFTPQGSRSSEAFNVTRFGQVGAGPPDIVPGADANSIRPQDYLQYFDPSVFVLPPAGYFGNVGRSTIIGPGQATVDFSVFKDTGLPMAGSQAKVQFRFEMFNVFNRANFGLPNARVFLGTGQVSPTVGRITTTSTRPRQIQLGVRFVF